MCRLLLLVLTMRHAAALHYVEPAALGGGGSGARAPESAVSNFRLLVPVSLAQDGEPHAQDGKPLCAATAPHNHRHHTHVVKDNLDVIKNILNVATRDVAKYNVDVSENERDGAAARDSVKHVGIDDRDADHEPEYRDAELHDLKHRWIKINLYDRVDGNIKLHNDDVIFVDEEAPRSIYLGAAEKGRGLVDGAFSDIPSSDFRLDEHRPSVKKELSVEPWLESVCHSMGLGREPVSEESAPCDLCCVVLRRPAGPPPPARPAAPAKTPASAPPALAPAPALATPPSEPATRLLAALGRALAARRDWQVMNPKQPARLFSAA